MDNAIFLNWTIRSSFYCVINMTPPFTSLCFRQYRIYLIRQTDTLHSIPYIFLTYVQCIPFLYFKLDYTGINILLKSHHSDSKQHDETCFFVLSFILFQQQQQQYQQYQFARLFIHSSIRSFIRSFIHWPRFIFSSIFHFMSRVLYSMIRTPVVVVVVVYSFVHSFIRSYVCSYRRFILSSIFIL